MSKENEKTLEVYDKLAKVYLDNTVKHDIKDPTRVKEKQTHIKKILKNGFKTLTSGAKILEIGAGDGSASLILKKLGFNPFPTDVAEDFLKAIKKSGFEPIKLNVLTDDIPNRYNGVLAYRVFVHFTPEDIKIAFNKIYDALVPSGRFVFNIVNKAAGVQDGWVDYPGDHHMGAERFFQQFHEPEIRQITESTGFNIINFSLFGGENNNKWFFIVAEKPLGVKSEILDYIEKEIIPRYQIAGHQTEHICQVISRSLNFAEQINDKKIKITDFTGCPSRKINPDMCYVIAAFHDLGRLIDDETHEKISAKMLLEDHTLPKFFTKEELKIMAEAVEDHRASSKHDPRSIYGKIVSSADRNINTNVMLKRCYEKVREDYPAETKDEVVERVRKILRKKYGGESGYAAKKMYFKDVDFEASLEKIEELTRNPVEFRKLYDNPTT